MKKIEELKKRHLAIILVAPIFLIQILYVLITNIKFKENKWFTIALNNDLTIPISDYFIILTSLYALFITAYFSYVIWRASNIANDIANKSYEDAQKPADINFALFEEIVMVNSKEYLFHIPITFYNKSQNVGIVNSMKINFKNLDDISNFTSYTWDSFCQDSIDGWTWRSLIRPIAIIGKQSYSDLITFRKENNCENLNGENYELELVVFYESNSSGKLEVNKVSRSYQFKIDQFEINFLNENDNYKIILKNIS